MLRRGFLIALLVVATVGVACGDDDGGTADDGESPTTEATADGGGGGGDAAAGEEFFQASCSGCHGADARGIEGVGKDLVASDFVDGLSDADLLAFVKQGRPASDPENTTGVDMPPKGGDPSLSDAEIADIIAYIRSLSP